VELGSWPIADHEVVQAVLDAGGDDAAALEALAADFVASFEADRTEGCGPTYRVVADEPVAVEVGGRDGLRLGFRGESAGVAAEQVVQHAVVDVDTLHLLTAAAYEPDGCVPKMGEFDVDDLRQAMDLIGDLAAGSRFPGSVDGR